MIQTPAFQTGLLMSAAVHAVAFALVIATPPRMMNPADASSPPSVTLTISLAASLPDATSTPTPALPSTPPVPAATKAPLPRPVQPAPETKATKTGMATPPTTGATVGALGSAQSVPHAPPVVTPPPSPSASQTVVKAQDATAPVPARIRAEPRFRVPPTPPAYPRLARRRGEEGTVLVDIWLSPTGALEGQVVYQSSGYSTLDTAALAAIRDWEFLPASLGDQPVPSRLRIPVTFALR